MTILITVLIILASLVALALIVALFSKKDYALYRDIVINRPKSEVFNYIRYLRNQDHYSQWVMRDPNMKKSYRGTDGTVGFVYAWDGNKQAGKGEQEIRGMDEGNRLDVEVRFERPFAAIATTPFTLQALSENSTKVTWGTSSRMNYPMNIMLLFIDMDKLLGKDLEISLETLKKILER